MKKIIAILFLLTGCVFGDISILNTFTSGELSPHLDARLDFDKYSSGCRTLENFIVLPYGGALKRPGTQYIADTKNGGVARLAPFSVGVDQTYIMELGAEYIRFYRDGVQLVDTSNVPFGSFVFVQNYRGIPDTVWVEKTTTAGALVQEFGEDGVSAKTKEIFDKDPEAEIKIVMHCAPRAKRDASKNDKKNKPFEYLVYEKDEKNLLEEGGTDLQKFIVYRVKRLGNETLGRGPCLDTVCTMNAIERASKDYQRAIRNTGVPIIGVAASMGQNGFRLIHQEDASVLVYNDTGLAQAPQTLNLDNNPDAILKYLEFVIPLMRQLFFLDYFNPLDNRRNMTLGEAKERVSKAQQMVDQIVGPFKEERLNPLLQWCMILLGEAGVFSKHGSWAEIQQKMAGRIEIRYKSRLANVQKKIRLMSIAEYTEMMMFIGQGIPDPAMQYEFLAQTDFSKLPNEIKEGTNAPDIIMRDPKKVKALVKQFQQSMVQRQQVEDSVKVADAASKGGTAPEQGSLTSRMLGEG